MDHDFNILLYQLLEATEIGDGLLELWNLLAWHVTRNVPALFVTLVVVIRPLRPLAENADCSPIQVLDLGDVLEDRLGSGFYVHGTGIYAIHIYQSNKIKPIT